MSEPIYMYVALRRKKDNTDLPTKCFRHVGIDGEEEAITTLMERASAHKGMWRIYRTVNKRDLDRAQKRLICELVREPDRHVAFIASLWKSMLLKCAAERKWLIDIDTKDLKLYNEVESYIGRMGGEIHSTIETPNGFHIVTSRFDTRNFNFPNVERHTDALLFLRTFHSKG